MGNPLSSLLHTARSRWASRHNQQPTPAPAVYAKGRAQVHRPRHSAENRSELTMPIVLPGAGRNMSTPWARQHLPVNQRSHE